MVEKVGWKKGSGNVKRILSCLENTVFSKSIPFAILSRQKDGFNYSVVELCSSNTEFTYSYGV